MVPCTSVPQSTCASDRRRCIFLGPEAFLTHGKQTHHGQAGIHEYRYGQALHAKTSAPFAASRRKAEGEDDDSENALRQRQ
jgi:hypothetical protein